MKILIIDDSDSKYSAISNAIKSMTGRKNLKIQHSKDVADASRKCKLTRFDLIILDVCLPISSDKEAVPAGGIQFLRSLHDQRSLKHPRKLIGLTAYSDNIEQYKSDFANECYTLIYYEPSSVDWVNKLSTVVGQSCDVQYKSLKKGIGENEKLALLETIIVFIVLFIVVLNVFFSIGLSPTSRTLLFWLCGILSGILFGSKTKSQFKISIPGFCFTTAGAAALSLGCLLMLHHLSREHFPVGIFTVTGYADSIAQLSQENIEVPIDGNGATAQTFLKASSLVVIFPKDSEMARVVIKSDENKLLFSGILRYVPGVIQEIVLDKLD